MKKKTIYDLNLHEEITLETENGKEVISYGDISSASTFYEWN